MARRKRNNYRLDVMSKLLLHHEKEKEEKEMVMGYIWRMRLCYRYSTSVAWPKPVSETETFTDTKREAKLELSKLEFRRWLWAPTPDGTWERALEESLRSLEAARAQADRWPIAEIGIGDQAIGPNRPRDQRSRDRPIAVIAIIHERLQKS